MLVHPQFDPIALQLGPLAVRWYGLMYLVGFGLIWIIGRSLIANRPGGAWTANDLGDAIFYGILGTILGGRFGYVLSMRQKSIRKRCTTIPVEGM